VRSAIADYQVVEPVPAPGGEVEYLCRPPARLGWDGPVAVREVALDAGTWPRACDQAARLARGGASTNLRLIEIGLDPEGPGGYLVTEASAGGTLADPRRPLAEPDKLSAVAAAARGAHAWHEAGMAHGNIHAATIALTERGPALAPPPLDRPDGVVTYARSWSALTCVDPDLLCGETPSRSSDIWSLGATLHAALVPGPLYPGLDRDEPVTAIQRIIFSRPQADPALPPAVGRIISRCLERDPAARYQNAAELADAIEAAGGTR
jgi:serine/threonine protein kinase